jgi:hypothetical protein
MSHTPGPWELQIDQGEWTIKPLEGYYLFGNAQYPWVSQNKSDWHLIAASPELRKEVEGPTFMGEPVLQKPKAGPEQEPVAEIEPDAVDLEEEMFDAAVSWCESNGIIVFEPEQLESLVSTLFVTVRDAAPQQPNHTEPSIEMVRKPLTDEQISAASKGHMTRNGFARAIEAAHGIKEGT